MTKVFEDPSGLNYETDYSYNILDQLTRVTAGPQTRSYVYDDLGRLLKTTTPEAGTLCFGSVTRTVFGTVLLSTSGSGAKSLPAALTPVPKIKP
jgi:YD repeat-containing protein